jgi:hypothetical protein
VSTIPKKNWKNLATRNAEGDYDLIEPLDYLILAEMQEEGTLMGGYYPLATNATALKKRFPELTSSLISTRLRVLHLQGLVVATKTPTTEGSKRSSRQAWQRTKKGKELVEAWQQRQA